MVTFRNRNNTDTAPINVITVFIHYTIFWHLAPLSTPFPLDRTSESGNLFRKGCRMGVPWEVLRDEPPVTKKKVPCT